MPQNDGTVLIEDARIMFRNFAGREKDFNPAGERNFCVLLDDDLAAQLRAQGWNIKELKAREEGDTPQPYVQVKVNYGKGKPPHCVMMSSRGRTELGADEVEILDIADLKKVDVILRPYQWKIREGTPQEASGTKAYLKTIFATINEDELELKYAETMEANRNFDAAMDGED